MLALTGSLAEEFGSAKVFRPYRDVRFAKDKTPYKTAQGAFVSVGPATGWYVEIGSPGVRVGRRLLPRRRPRPRPHPHGHRHRALRRGARADRRAAGEATGSRSAASSSRPHPRGYPADHPRIDLLRYKSMALGKSYGFENLNTPALADRVRDDWRALRPLVEWVAARVDIIG